MGRSFSAEDCVVSMTEEWPPLCLAPRQSAARESEGPNFLPQVVEPRPWVAKNSAPRFPSAPDARCTGKGNHITCTS